MALIIFTVHAATALACLLQLPVKSDSITDLTIFFKSLLAYLGLPCVKMKIGLGLLKARAAILSLVLVDYKSVDPNKLAVRLRGEASEATVCFLEPH